jgi:hypothetical protein
VPEVQKPRAPGGLGVAGRRLWKTVILDADSQQIDLDSRELTWLEDACRLTDRLDQLEAELAAAGTFMTLGVAKQPVAHPLLGEIRQTRALRAQMLARITVTAPEEKQTGAGVFPLGVQQRDAANSRWKKGWA